MQQINGTTLANSRINVIPYGYLNMISWYDFFLFFEINGIGSKVIKITIQIVARVLLQSTL